MTLTPEATLSGAARRLARKPRIALIGVHGFGARHLDRLRHLQAEGQLVLAAVADPNPPEPGELDPGVAVFATADELLAAGTDPDVVIVATPIHTHAAIAVAALRAGADVYLEKPAAASLEQYEQIQTAAAQAGRAVQVGFQSLGSAALERIARLVASGTIGDIRGISATGTWVRTRAYFSRSRWAGRRTLDGLDVVDGVVTNPLAHAVATALRIADARSTGDVKSVELDHYRAHDIEGDDTTVVRIRTTANRTVMCALTVCAAEQTDPFITLHGTQGEAVFYYTADRLVITTPDAVQTMNFDRVGLLENLLAHRSDGTALLSSLEDSGAFMRVLEEIRTAEPAAAIDASYVEWIGEGGDAHPVIANIGDFVQRAVKAQATFSELGAPWARPLPGTAGFTVNGVVVAEERSGTRIASTSSPRPYLHPVRTLAGTVVTDHQPADHVWHLGAGVALQDVNGVNFWGGRTYRREAGAYVWRSDHGTIRQAAADPADGALAETLEWVGPDGSVLLQEQRNWRFGPLDQATWRLDLDFTLSPAGTEPVLLGSPGSNGRPGGGYGGFFWRLPACTGVDVRTGNASGEDAVHGTTAPWLAWTADFAGRPATLVFLAGDEAADPWFVRQSGYPGVGLSLAWDTPVPLSPGSSLTRSVSVLVADGALTDSDVRELAATAARSTPAQPSVPKESR